jgi:hypothetical protein
MVYDPNCWMPGDGSFEEWRFYNQLRANPQKAQQLPDLIDYHVGIDLGQKHDHSAVAVLEVRLNSAYEQYYFGRYLHRFKLGLLYGSVVKQLQKLNNELRATGGSKDVSITWAVDATGVGAGVAEMITKALPTETVIAIYLTGGITTTMPSWCEVHLPKSQMISALVAAFSSGTMHLPANARELDSVIEELTSYEIRVSEAGWDSYGAFKTGAHDDLVTALGLSLWSAQTNGITSPVLLW